MKRYNPKEIEPAMRQYWSDQHTYQADLTSAKPKYIAMSMFNYPSGAGIHIGHAMNYTISDVMARLKRQQGFESYHPVGWDAFGLPAENYAIKAGVSPQNSMATIIPGYHKQYQAMGWSNDWSKEISTHMPIYYRWTQWIFSQMYTHGLAYQDARMQWWCSKCQTVLANEQVIDGKCWRHDGADDPEVTKREVKQWFFKITDYADELLEAIDDLDWTETVKLAQKNWIGRSVGAEIDFKVDGSDQKITVFTTRPDTIYGATFLVLAPEHELVDGLTTDKNRAAVEEYKKESAKKTEVQRQASKQKSGVFTGFYAVNPATKEQIPIWIADYVLVGYGTGAIMAVPAHDDRDHEFAAKFKLPIIQVVAEREIDVRSPHRSDKQLVERNVVTCVIEHPDGKQYLIAKPVAGDNWAPLMGGIDDGEEILDTARRELLEETGLYDIDLIERKGDVFASEFFAVHKDVNRIAYCNIVYIKLKSLDTKPELAIDKDAQVTKWVGEDEWRRLSSGSGGMERVLDTTLGRSAELSYEGRLINSRDYSGSLSDQVRDQIVADLADQGVAREKVNYKIRDWSVSRQRYWGAPIPIINCAKCGPQLVPDDQLPVLLPELDDFQPSGDGRSALARATDWLKADCPKCGGKGQRETDTLDTYICSSWYFLRYFDPANESAIFDSQIANKWMPIDFYNGGDHATAHMIYARFVTRFFHKLGLVDNPEPFKKFLFNGKITASDGSAFSKSKGNGIDPLEIINDGYGADALRTYLMFAAPLEFGARWDPQGVPGCYRFLNRLWNISQQFIEAEKDNAESKDVLRAIHPAIKKVTEDLEDQKYNTAIAAMMKAVNDLYNLQAKAKFAGSKSWQFALESLAQLVAPFAPHTAEALWQDLSQSGSVNKDNWPKWDEKYLVGDQITLAVQINGKVRAEIRVAADVSQADATQTALANPDVIRYLDGKSPKKVIYVAGRLVSIVI